MLRVLAQRSPSGIAPRVPFECTRICASTFVKLAHVNAAVVITLNEPLYQSSSRIFNPQHVLIILKLFVSGGGALGEVEYGEWASTVRVALVHVSADRAKIIGNSLGCSGRMTGHTKIGTGRSHGAKTGNKIYFYLWPCRRQTYVVTSVAGRCMGHISRRYLCSFTTKWTTPLKAPPENSPFVQTHPAQSRNTTNPQRSR
jgi:hypothetical protein